MTRQTRQTDPRYRWSHPREWLTHHLESPEHDRDDLIRIAQELASKLDGDQIQDLFQADMDADRYFQDLNKCPDCDSFLTDRTMTGPYPSYCDECDREVEIES